MIKGDEGKPMTIFEAISDEPCEVEPYLDYLLESERAHRAYWDGLPNNHDLGLPTARECVLAHLDGFIISLENIKQKMHRPTREQPPSINAIDPSAQHRESRPRAADESSSEKLIAVRAALGQLEQQIRTSANATMTWTNHPEFEPKLIYSAEARAAFTWCADQLAALIATLPQLIEEKDVTLTRRDKLASSTDDPPHPSVGDMSTDPAEKEPE